MKKYIKPIVVMLAIILLCGGLLAVLSDLLYVTNEERIQRAIDKIYNDQTVLLENEINVEEIDMSEYESVGVVKACYKLSNSDYLVLTTGKKGYSNGTVTSYVAIDSAFNVKKVVQDSYSGQTLMSKLTGIYSNYEGKNSTDSKEEFDSIVVSGATYSSQATSNSVYVALKFVQKIGG